VALHPQCRWIVFDDGYCTLAYNCGCVGAVRPRNGYVETRVTWQRSEHYVRAASMVQGRCFVERCIGAGKGFLDTSVVIPSHAPALHCH